MPRFTSMDGWSDYIKSMTAGQPAQGFPDGSRTPGTRGLRVGPPSALQTPVNPRVGVPTVAGPPAGPPALRPVGGLPSTTGRVIDITPPKAPRVPGAGIEGMGDFATGAANEIGAVGRGGGLKGLVRAAGGAVGRAGRAAFSGPGLVVQGLAVPAGMQADATAGANLRHGIGTADVQGASGNTYPRLFGASGTGLPEGSSVSAGAVSFSDQYAPLRSTLGLAPRTGVPVIGANQVYAPAGGAEASGATSAVPWEQSDAYRKMVKYTAGNNLPDAVPAAPAAPAEDPNGYAIVGGKRINYGDIGVRGKDAALAGAKNYSFSVGLPNTEPEVSQAYKDQVAKAVEANRLAGIAPSAEQRRLLGLSSMVTAQEMAAQAGWSPKGLNLARGQQLADQANTTALREQEVGVSRVNAEANLGLRRAESAQTPSKIRLNEAQAKYWGSRPEEAEAKVAAAEGKTAAVLSAAEQKVKQAAEGAELKAIQADPQAMAIYNSTGGNLQDYKDLQAIAAQKQWTYNARPKTKGFGPFKSTTPQGFLTADGQPINPDTIPTILQRYRAQRNS